MKPTLRVLLATVAALMCANALPGGQYDQEAWHVLNLAIDSGGDSAEKVFRLLGAIDDEEARKLLDKTLKNGGWWASVSSQGLSVAQCRFYLPLLKKLTESASPEGIQFVLGAIATAGGTEGAEILQSVADKSDDPIAGVAFGFLESMGSIAIQALAREALSGRTAPKRETAIYALARIGPARKDTAAFSTGLHDPDQPVRLAAALGLAKLGLADGESELEVAAKSGSADDRREASVALAALGRSQAISRLRSLISGADRSERMKVIWAVARIDGPKLKDFVYTQGLEKNPEFGSMLAEKLLDPSDPRDLTVLRGMLSSPDEIARLSAAERLLTTRFSGEAQAVIAGALESRDEGVRHLALELASKNPELQPALARFLESSDPEIRQAAITATGNLRQREKFARITVYLSDSSPAVSLAAARALASIDASAARPIFLQGLTSDLSHVRIYSAATLLTVDRELLRPKP